MVEKIVTKKAEVAHHLSELDVPEVLLREAIEASERLRQGMNPNYPRIASGFMPWAELVCALRDRLLPLKWRKSDEGGLPLVIHPSGRWAIAVLTGNESTGVNPNELRSKYPRGPRTKEIIASNAGQLEFDGLGHQQKVIPLPEQKMLTWYLMLHRTDGCVQFELSLPYAIGEDDRVVGWKKRILFEPLVFDAAKLDIEKPVEVSEDIEIEITPRI